jgi:hypothetical protein
LLRKLWYWFRRYDLERRVLDLERHFVIERNAEGNPTKTLADIPVEKREELRNRPLRGASWQQRKAWLEATDGGRRASQ